MQAKEEPNFKLQKGIQEILKEMKEKPIGCTTIPPDQLEWRFDVLREFMTALIPLTKIDELRTKHR